jgi:hypothetical protein
MKKIHVVILVVFFLVGIPFASADATPPPPPPPLPLAPATGDVDFDNTLHHLDREARYDLSTFISDLHVTFGIPVIEIRHLLFEVRIAPADVYMILGFSQITRKPVNVVLKDYKRHRGRGWGVIAKQLGIKPGSKAFHALKANGGVHLRKMKAAKVKKSKSRPAKGKPGKAGKKKGKKK